MLFRSGNETSFAAVTGTITAGDVDGTIASYEVQTGTGTTGTSKAGSYGTLTLAGNGYSYAPNVSAVNALAAGSNQMDSFTLVVKDNSGASVTQTLTFNITATNDAPTITSVTPTTGVTDGSGNETSFAAVTGTITAGDVDGTIASYEVQTGTGTTGKIGRAHV